MGGGGELHMTSPVFVTLPTATQKGFLIPEMKNLEQNNAIYANNYNCECPRCMDGWDQCKHIAYIKVYIMLLQVHP